MFAAMNWAIVQHLVGVWYQTKYRWVPNALVCPKRFLFWDFRLSFEYYFAVFGHNRHFHPAKDKSIKISKKSLKSNNSIFHFNAFIVSYIIFHPSRDKTWCLRHFFRIFLSRSHFYHFCFSSLRSRLINKKRKEWKKIASAAPVWTLTNFDITTKKIDQYVQGCLRQPLDLSKFHVAFESPASYVFVLPLFFFANCVYSRKFDVIAKKQMFSLVVSVNS